MMMKLLIPIMIITLVCCSHPDANTLEVRNSSEYTLYSAAFDEDILQVIDWLPAEQNPIAPGTSRIFEEDDIMGYSGSNKIVLYCWTIVNPDSLPFSWEYVQGLTWYKISASDFKEGFTVNVSDLIF